MDGEASLAIVKRMWIDYREQGVEQALSLCHPDVEFQGSDGRMWEGHDGIRAFFAQFRDDSQFAASPYTFEPSGRGVVVAGHRRIRTDSGADGEYMYFSHHVRDGLIVRMAAWETRGEATADLGAVDA